MQIVKGTRRCLHQDRKSITPSLHLCFFQDLNPFYLDIIKYDGFFPLHSYNYIIKKQQFRAKQRCRDGVNDFLSWCRHLLVPFLFHDVTSLHPPSFHGNDFSTCVYTKSAIFTLRKTRMRLCARMRTRGTAVFCNHEQAPSVVRMRTKGGGIFGARVCNGASWRAGFLIYYCSCSRVSGFLPWIPAISVKFFPGYLS